MTGFWQRIFGGGKAVRIAPAFTTLSLADGPVYAVGDVHGCHAAYLALEEMIRADCDALGQSPRIVLLGDMIDRGNDTAGLLDDLVTPMRGGQRFAIRGNHEDMMLSFLDDPAGRAEWLDFGGFETLRSYGLALDGEALRGMSARRIQQVLAAYLPQDHLAFLKSLPFGFKVEGQDQHWVLCHAGYDPARSLDAQNPEILLWGGAAPQKGDALRLVHGHVIAEMVDLAAQSVGIDTGAYKTGVLTAVRLAQSQPPRLLQTGMLPLRH